MTTNNFQQSAQIYQFPARVRATSVSSDFGDVASVMSPRLAKAAFGSGWYHDAAIQEAERPAKKTIANVVPIR
jgi:hypothetical protein